MDQSLGAVGRDILFAARNELYMALPYLDVALCSLRFEEAGQVTASIATEGETLYFSPSFVAERYLRGRTAINRAYLHVILHCMLRHPWKKKGHVPELWDLACDAAAESILDDMSYACLRGTDTPAKKKFYGECRAEMPVLTAEGIYHRLLSLRLTDYELAQLTRLFLVDDHGLWDGEEKNDREKQDERDQKWKSISEKTETSMETVLAKEGVGGEAVLEQVKVAVQEQADYRAFLRRFAAPREIMAVDGDAFDYIYYTYGLSHYGNMPLVEPPETKEEKRIEDFVIAVDTSMSTSGELVRQFLACTYAILRSTETFTRKVNIHILQCDDQVRSDVTIHDLEELRRYMEDFRLLGGSATDFRPVFTHVDGLMKSGAFTSLRGLLYFTDGMGQYPTKRPPYDVAFILLDEPPLSVQIPPWAIRLTLTLPALEKAKQEAEALDEALQLEELNELPEL